MHVLPSLAAVENVAFQLLILVALIGVAAVVARRVPDLRTVAIVLGALALSHLAVFTSLVPRGLIHSHWNWDGKILSTIVTLILIAVIPSLSWDAVGFRWKQNGGTIPALVAAAILCAFSWTLALLIPHVHRVPTAETLWYQALIPGPSEEPLYRGLALVLLDRAFGNRYWQIAGAPFGFGALLMGIWFGFIHGCGIVDGRPVFDWLTIAAIGTDGLLFGWIRMRTGSLVIPIFAHALVDVGDNLIG